jgi:pimeloyl-ACP methyl ester carboxylesterase
LTAVLAATVGCDAEAPASAPTTPAASDSIADQAPPPAQRCRKPDDGTVAKVVVTASDGTELAAAAWGEGERGVALLPQRGGDLCGYWDYASELAAAGFHLLAIDFRRSGLSESAAVGDLTLDAVAAVEWLKSAGATNVVLVGASMGATTAMVTAGRHPDLVSGVVALSLPPAIDVTDGNGPEPSTAEAAAPLIDVPLLMCWADRDTSAVDPQPLVDASPGADKQVITRPGLSHGWSMLRDGEADVRPELLAFLEQHT